MKQIAVVIALAITALSMSGCSAEEAMRFGWPKGVTPEAESMRHLWTWSVIAALLMGVIVWALTFWTITFHRRKRGAAVSEDEFPRQTAYNVPLELTYTAIPFVIIAVLFYFTVIVQNDVEGKKPDPAVTVDVTAFQWNWKFGYRQVAMGDGTRYNGFLRNGSPYELQEERNRTPEGEELPGPAGGRDDDIRDYLKFDRIETVGTSDEIPVLVLPIGERIEFEQASADVIHSFWVPDFLFKRDVMPFPKQNHTDNRWQVSSIDSVGAYVGRCAEMCGTYHSMMNFEVRAVTKDRFDNYISYRSANPNATNAQALQHICETPLSVTTQPFDTRRDSGGAAAASTSGGNASNTSIPGCTVTPATAGAVQ